ncbi:MAG: hypothetical protein ABI450_09050 [Rhizomicrobium sp.]
MRISMRRCPAGVDRRFDDPAETNELIRLAQRGHVFSAGDAMDRTITDNINRAARCGPLDS